MKLLYISNQRLPTEKAYGIQIAKMCEAFADLGNEVTLMLPFRYNSIREDFFHYYAVRKNSKLKKVFAPDFYLPGRLDRLAFEIKMFFSGMILSLAVLRRKADIIYSRDEWPLYFLSFFRKNIVFEAHKFSKAKNFFYRKLCRVGARLVVISNGLKSAFVKNGWPEEKILVAPDGVDLKQFNLEITKEEARKIQGLPLDKKIVLYSGHLYEWKGVETLLETAKLISNKNEDVIFVFVGGTDEDVREFKKKAAGLKNVLILGYRPHSQIPTYLQSADVLVLPNKSGTNISEEFTSPLKLFEYMASGRPIVASNLSSLREVLNDKNSVLVEPDNPKALADGIKLAINNDSHSESLARQALEDVQLSSWEQRAKKIIKFTVYEK